MFRARRRRLWIVSLTPLVIAASTAAAAGIGASSSGAAGASHSHQSSCPHPSVRVPPNEPVYRTGPTELVSGLYVQGGPVPPPPCKPEPRGPYAGRITVTNASTGAAVATKTVRDGHLAHIP